MTDGACVAVCLFPRAKRKKLFFPRVKRHTIHLIRKIQALTQSLTTTNIHITQCLDRPFLPTRLSALPCCHWPCLSTAKASLFLLRLLFLLPSALAQLLPRRPDKLTLEGLTRSRPRWTKSKTPLLQLPARRVPLRLERNSNSSERTRVNKLT